MTMRSVGVELIHGERWRDMMKVTGAFHDFVNTAKSWKRNGFIMQVDTGTKFLVQCQQKHIHMTFLILDWDTYA
jgi:hypothetical protein